ncbi:hypothetical protein N0V90_001453 [Kalmusia sp. IMI 367209]|nr:hypothetical protein N0V90_001453 [Kalmusia sp. IMI 367209]
MSIRAGTRKKALRLTSPPRVPTSSANDSTETTQFSHPDLTRVVAVAVPEPSSRIASIFIGDGGYGAILEAVSETTDRHFHVFATVEKELAAEDLEYLKVKGCFTLPVERNELLEGYFRFVHPTFPVIDGHAFLQQYATHGFEGINLLLLWSIFSVSASYVPTLKRKACKEIYVARAKLLFDLSHENDKIVLVQSSLLLSFWFADTEDVKQSWYWTGIAFSIAQTLGLHSEVKPTNVHVPVQQRSFWRNIWRCCLMRDVWQAFGRGRPLRIHATSKDSPYSEDASYLFTNLILHGKRLYSPGEAAELASMWQSLITISDLLRYIITKKTLSVLEQNSCKIQSNNKLSVTSSTPIFIYTHRHLELHRCAALLALARATGSKEDSEHAADETTIIIEAFLHDNITTYAAPTTVPLIVPAIATYLAALKSEDPNTKKLANEKLDIYSQFLTALDDNYPAASMLKRLFSAAQEAIIGNDTGVSMEENRSVFAKHVDLWYDLEWLGKEGVFAMP